MTQSALYDCLKQLGFEPTDPSKYWMLWKKEIGEKELFASIQGWDEGSLKVTIYNEALNPITRELTTIEDISKQIKSLETTAGNKLP